MKEVAGFDRAGFVGLGQMGGAMAMRLLDSGLQMVVCDLSPAAVKPFAERGAKVVGSPREVADAAPIVFTSLNTGDISKAVALGPSGLIHGNAMKFYIEMSTIGPAPIREMAKAMDAKGVGFIESPVSGGYRGARAGTLATMAAGNRKTFDRIRPILELIAPKIVFVSEQPGAAQIGKIVNNILSIVGIAATCEAMALGVKAGLDASTLIELINMSSGRNAATLEKFPASILTRKFDFGASFVNQLKTMGLYLEETKRLGTPAWVTPHVLAVYEKIAADIKSEGKADDDASRIVRLVEELANVEIKGEPPRSRAAQ